MRLIDADKLKVLVAVENNGVMNTGKLITELFDEMETVEAIPIEWIDHYIKHKVEVAGINEEVLYINDMIKEWEAENG